MENQTEQTPTQGQAPIPQGNPPTKPPFWKSKWFLLLLIGALAILPFLLYGAYYMGLKDSEAPPPAPEVSACTLDAKTCPDGSVVGRQGPNCEFAPCPGESEESSDETAGWETYQDSDFGISFKYPPSYGEIVKIESPKGKLIGFSKQGSIVFGAYINDPDSPGRGLAIYDFNGYKTINDAYYFNDWTGQLYQKIEPKKVLSVLEQEIPIVTKESFAKSPLLLENHSAALINLKDSAFSGIVISNGNNDGRGGMFDPIPDSEFEQILSTFKFTDSVPKSECTAVAGDAEDNGLPPCPTGYVCQFKGEYPNRYGTCVKE